MTKRQQHVTIARIMQSLWDTKRAFGGYPAQYVIEHGKVYVADCEDVEPFLTVTSIEVFIQQNSWALEG